jgi:hypothetical protein
MTADQIIPMEEELSYYEEEISVYDTGLSTIQEVENESDESDDESVSSVEVKCSRSSLSEMPPLPPPPNDSSELVTPKPYANNNKNNNSLSRKFMESPGFALVSPPIMSQKIHFSNLSPLAKLPSLVGNSPLTSSYSLPSPAKRPNNLSLSMTHHLTHQLTGEDVVIHDDDDEYTFVSCSDTDSFFGDYADMSVTDLETSWRRDSDMDQSIGLDSSLRSSSASLGGSASSELDFDSKKTRLEEALERRANRHDGNLAVEIDGFRRKLRYDLTRKMFKEQLQRCRSKPHSREPVDP